MFHNYLLVTLRNIRNNKLFSAINIAGLAIGLSACFLIWQYVRFESGYDKFHKNADQLYRVTLEIRENAELVQSRASNVPAVGHAMKSEFPEVKESCRLVQTSLFTSDLGKYIANALEFSYQDQSGKVTAFIEENVWFADAPLLDMFSFPMVEGVTNALKEPNTVVITKKIATKFFGNEPALGRILKLNNDLTFKITGVIEDVPVNSHLQFDILVSFTTLHSGIGDMYDNWGWSSFYNYVLLEKGSDVDALRAKLSAFDTKFNGPGDNNPRKISVGLQPITDIHLRSQFDNEQSPVGNERTVYFLSILAIFILVVAWINYINLSTSKALQRSKEVGLRKTVGASRAQLITQFLFDTVLINTFALIISAAIVFISWSSFEKLIGKEISSVLSTGGTTPWIIAAVVFVAGVAICGVYPALSLSSFTPAAVLKGKLTASSSGAFLRKLMVSFQYVLAVLLIAGTTTIYLQLSYMRSRDTGFTKEQVIVTEAPATFDSTANSRIAFFKNELLTNRTIKNVTATSDVPGAHIVEGSGVGLTNAKEDEFFGTSISSRYQFLQHTGTESAGRQVV